MDIPIKLLDSAAKLPRRANPGDAGLDLCALMGGAIEPGDRAMIRTGISVAIPEGYYGRVAPRSGLAVKKGIGIMAGVVDSIYRGEVCVVLINHDKINTFYWEAGDRIAQLIIEKYHNVNWQVVDTLPESVRGENGWGSSGV
jgi:dUTP pyrophosphatase